jgi:hypothetical protein
MPPIPSRVFCFITSLSSRSSATFDVADALIPISSTCRPFQASHHEIPCVIGTSNIPATILPMLQTNIRFLD